MVKGTDFGNCTMFSVTPTHDHVCKCFSNLYEIQCSRNLHSYSGNTEVSGRILRYMVMTGTGCIGTKVAGPNILYRLTILYLYQNIDFKSPKM